MKLIGLTGRSGCGKSSVAAYLAEQGCPIADADEISRQVLLPGSPCLPLLQKQFGSDILDKDGALCRRLLADRAFATKKGTAALTEITFPEILRRIHRAAEKAEKQGSTLFFVDGAVIVGTPFERECAALVVVTAPFEESVRRICARDDIAPEMAARRLNAQTPEVVLRDAADYVIENDGDFPHLLRQTQQVLASLRKEEYEETR